MIEKNESGEEGERCWLIGMRRRERLQEEMNGKGGDVRKESFVQKVYFL